MESTSRLWLDPERERARSERSDRYGTSFSVHVGDGWWSYHPQTGAMSNEGDRSVRSGGADEASALLDPAVLLGGLDFDQIGERLHAGRRSHVVRATRRPHGDPDEFDRHLSDGADDFELIVDAEIGVLLRMETRIDGELFAVLELSEVEFDRPFPDELFEFRPPPGEEVRSVHDRFARPEGMSVEAAARRAPFTVLAPSRVPEGWDLSTLYWPGNDRPPSPPGVVMNLTAPTGQQRLRILQGADPSGDSLDWIATEFRGERFLVNEPGLGDEIECKLERHGTHVRLTGSIEREALLEIAQSLQPAPRELPPLREA
jgi:hypothetical protein